MYRSEDPDSGFTRLSEELVTKATFVDTNVVLRTTYYYAVTATDLNSNESVFSNVATVVTAELSLAVYATLVIVLALGMAYLTMDVALLRKKRFHRD